MYILAVHSTVSFDLQTTVASNQQNVHVLHTLLDDLKKMIANYYCWGRPLGSTILWEQHLKSLEKICQKAASIQIKQVIERKCHYQSSNHAVLLLTLQPEVEGSKKLSDLPEELIREILLRLSDYKDLINSGDAFPVANSLINDEQHIWKELCNYHFSEQQIVMAKERCPVREGKTDYEQIFQLLRR